MTEPTPTLEIDLRLDDSKTEAEILALTNGDNKLMIASDSPNRAYIISPTGVKQLLFIGSGDSVLEQLVGTVDGVNTSFTITSGPAAGDFGLIFRNGVLVAENEYTITDSDLEFSVAPGAGTELLIALNIGLSGAGVVSFNTRQGTVVPSSGDYDMSMISPLEHVITVSPVNGDFASVKSAMASITDSDSDNRYTILIGPGIFLESNPIELKPYVSIRSIGGPQTTRITATVVGENLFDAPSTSTLSDNYNIEGITMWGVSGSTSYAIDMSQAGTATVKDCGVGECSNGILLNNASGNIDICGVSFANPTATTTRGIYVEAGNAVISNVSTTFGLMTTLIEATGSGSVMTLDNVRTFNSLLTTGIVVGDECRAVISSVSIVGCVDGMVADGGAVAKVNGSRVFNCTGDGVRINNVGTGTDVTMQSVNIEDSTGFDVNLLSSTCVVSGDGKITLDKVNRVPGARANFIMIDKKEDDEGTNIIGELHVGTESNGSESAFGEGDSYTRGMLVYTETSGGTFADVSEEARSASASTFTFPAVAADNAVYVASSLENETDFLEHYGIKTKVETAAVLGTGEIVAEYWNGTAWTEVNAMEVQSSGQYFPNAKDYFTSTGSCHIRYDPALATDSWTKNDPMSIGTDYYWMRFRIDSTITTAPVFEQFKLHTSRFEVNADGWTEFFGKARPVGQLPFFIGQDKALSGNLGNISLWLNEDVGSGLNENEFNAVGDTIGRSFFMPQDMDTSGKIKMKLVGRPAGTGTTEFTVRWDGMTEGDTLYTANPALSPGVRESIVSQAVTTGSAAFYDFELDVSNFIARRDGGQPDVLSITIEATALGGGNFAMFAIEAEYTKWCAGGHV